MKSNIGKWIENLYKGVVTSFASLLFREVNGKSVTSGRADAPVGRAPVPSKSSTLSRKATAYAKKKSSDSSYRQKADQSNTTPYNIALADFLNPPTIYGIEAGDYKGLPGSDIRIEAADDFQVASVKVRIMDGRGNLVEEGQASPQGGIAWHYLTTAVNKNFSGSVIAAVAYDKPGGTALYAIREDGKVATAETYLKEAS